MPTVKRKRHLTNEGQECKTGYIEGRTLLEKEMKEESKEE
jgi:hypothetical protein